MLRYAVLCCAVPCVCSIRLLHAVKGQGFLATCLYCGPALEKSGKQKDDIAEFVEYFP